jgi:hypothetical protein
MKRMAMGVVLCLLFSSAPNVSNRAATQTQKDVPPLRLKLATVRGGLCQGAALKVQAEIVNESNERAVIDVSAIWYRISFNYFRRGPSRTNPDGSGSGENKGGSLTKVGDPGPGYEGKNLVLGPGESYKATNTLKLGDQFFNSPGDYRMKVAYGQFLDKSFEGLSVWRGTVESNELNFKIAACKSKHRRDNGHLLVRLASAVP